MGRVRQAYALTGNEVENVIQALWPGDVFPLELWHRAHEKFWKAFADSNQAVYKIETPALPELDTAKEYFHTYLCSLDVLDFFKKMSEIIKANIVQEGLRYILEESYNEIDEIFSEEKDFLFSTLLKFETIDQFGQYEQYSENGFNSIYEDKILYIPHSSYHFISHIFPDTVLVDTIAVIRHLHYCPLRLEVKGITQRIVDFVLSLPVSATTPPAEPVAEEQPQGQKSVFRIPAALWEGRPEAAVRDAMKADYCLPIIAYVLVNWCGISKTQAGRLLSEKEYKEDKSYRNVVDNLLEEAASYTIIKS